MNFLILLLALLLISLGAYAETAPNFSYDA